MLAVLATLAAVRLACASAFLASFSALVTAALCCLDRVDIEDLAPAAPSSITEPRKSMLWAFLRK
jgi:hypothetical protein